MQEICIKQKDNTYDGYDTEYIDLDALMMAYLEFYHITRQRQSEKIKQFIGRLIRDSKSSGVEIQQETVA